MCTNHDLYFISRQFSLVVNVIFYILFEESYKFLLHDKSPILFLLHSFHLLVSYRVYEPIWLYFDTNVHREL
jgi:hypothetical protein